MKPSPGRWIPAACRSCTALLLGLFCLPIAQAGAGEPAGKLSRLVPAQGLSLYLEYDGLEAHADAWKATAASRILTETPAGAMITDATRQAIDRLLKIAPGDPITGSDVFALHNHLTRHGFALASLQEGEKTIHVFMFPKMGRGESMALLRTLLRFLLEEDKAASKSVQVRGRDLHEAQKAKNDDGLLGFDFPRASHTWWQEGDTLILVKGPDAELSSLLGDRHEAEKNLVALHKACVERVLDAIDGKSPNASTHPMLVAAEAEGRDIDGFVPNGLFVVDSTEDKGVKEDLRRAAGEIASESSTEFMILEALGVSRAKRVIVRWGFRGKALLTDLRFEASGADGTKGGLFEKAGFPKDRLPPIPRRAGAFVVCTPRRPPDWEAVASTFQGVELCAEYRPHFEAAQIVFADAQNHRLLSDLVGHMGPAWCLYASPGGPTGKATVPTLVAGVADARALERSLDAAATRLNAFFREQEFGEGDTEKQETRVAAIMLERLPGAERGYRLTSPENRVPWLTDTLQPTILLGKSFIVFAANPQLARAALAAEQMAEERWEPSGETARLFECLPANVSILHVGNPRDSFWPEAIVKISDTAYPALARFVGVETDGRSPQPARSELLSLLGIEPSRVSPAARAGEPLKAEDLRALIFPSVLAVGFDDRGLRILSLEALPFGCLGANVDHERGGFSKAISIEPMFAPGR